VGVTTSNESKLIKLQDVKELSVATSKILVIDDSRVIRKTVRDMLPEGDFEIIEAKDGLEGIDFVEKEHPSLIMLDFILPKMSGWDVFQQIQAHPEYQKIPLVLMSGKKEEVTSKISEPFEYFEFIEKPFDRVILADAIRLAMTKARKARPRISDSFGSDRLVSDGNVSSDEIALLQAQIDRIEKSTTTQIQALQSQLAAVEPSSPTEMQEFIAKFEAFQQAKATEHQAMIAKVIQLETEVDTLKKQLSQLVVLIKKKFATP
jgi:CheY-like chemotaxis protein